ncbi:MAG: glycosyltransferase [Nitrospirae bacterium]|nr:glycosyltransferase [Nitrospirota bacterium]
MRFRDPINFVRWARKAQCVPKTEFIRKFVTGKDVLDLGVVAHSLDYMKKTPDKWLHGLICEHAGKVVGVDILKSEISELQEMGYNVINDDVLTLDLDRQFDVIVCGDLIEHVWNHDALLHSISRHLLDDGVALITTPNPFSANRFFNILFDGWTAINTEHTCWLCPQTVFQLVERAGLRIVDFYWISTDFPMSTKNRYWGGIANRIASALQKKNGLLRTDYGIVVKKKIPHVSYEDGALPFVSVVLPTYNRPSYAISAVESLFMQDYPREKYEVLIVDNGTSDETEMCVRAFFRDYLSPVTVKYIREQRRGLVYARHTGAAQAAGEIILFGDDDARYEPNWISAIADVYRQNPEVGAVGTKIEIEWDQTPETWVLHYEGVLGRLTYDTETVIDMGLQIYGGSFSIREKVLRDLNGFNPGQMGEYILGDSETGLCDKLAKARIPVGWTPHTIMWHKQEVSKQGTLTDIKRRFWNNGICLAYRDNVASEMRGLVDRFQILKRIVSLLKRTVKGLIYRQKPYQTMLDYTLFTAYLWYTLRFHFDFKLRKKILSQDWAYNKDYIPSPVTFSVNGKGK